MIRSFEVLLVLLYATFVAGRPSLWKKLLEGSHQPTSGDLDLSQANSDSSIEYDLDPRSLPEALRSQLLAKYPQGLTNIKAQLHITFPSDAEVVPLDAEEDSGEADGMWLAGPLADSEVDYDNKLLNSGSEMNIPVKIKLPTLKDNQDGSPSLSTQKKGRERKKLRHRKNRNKRKHRKSRKNIHRTDINFQADHS